MEEPTKYVVARNGSKDVVVLADRFESNGKALRFFVGEDNQQVAVFAEGHWSYVFLKGTMSDSPNRGIL